MLPFYFFNCFFILGDAALNVISVFIELHSSSTLTNQIVFYLDLHVVSVNVA
jgi:hypothetical protein